MISHHKFNSIHDSEITLPYIQAVHFLRYILETDFVKDINFVKNSLILLNSSNQQQLKYNYPLLLNLTEDIINKTHLLHDLIKQPPNSLLMLIQAGNAALGFYNHGILTHHKVVRKYMVRKKQGKAQISYLNTKGKSRAGSRIRLANTVKFFEEINQIITDWLSNQTTDTIIYSCTPQLWGMLFRSKTQTPFVKKDERLKKLPLDTGIPNFEVLKKAANYCQKGYIEILPDCEENYLEVIKNYLKFLEVDIK